MNKILSKKELFRLLLLVSFVYLILQAMLFFNNNDKNISRFFWLENKKIKELRDAGKSDKSGLTPVIRFISDNHFWLLRAGVLATLLLTYYYKDKNEDLYNLSLNIMISVIITLLLVSGITWLLKIVVGKPRPYTNLNVFLPFNLSTKFQSFPSGHTTETFSYIIPYMYFIRKYYVFFLLSLYGSLAAFTRVVLSYHYFTDILFGIYISIVLGYIVCFFIEHKRMQNR